MSSPTGPTPPPPPMYPVASSPIAPEPAGPGLSEPQRLINTFIAPSKTFADMQAQSQLVGAMVDLGCIHRHFFGIVAVQKIDMAQLRPASRLTNHHRRNGAWNSLTPEQRAQGLAMQATITKVDLLHARRFSP